MTEAEFVTQVGRKPTEAERVSHGIPWLPVIAPEVPPIVLAPEAGASEAGESIPVAEVSIRANVTDSPVASGPPAIPGEATGSVGEDPNAGASPAAASSPAVGDSAQDASAGAGALSSGANSDELPLHVKVAHHLEAIYRLVKGE